MRSISSIALLLLILGCATEQQQQTVFPGEVWKTSTPEQQGIDSSKLEQALLVLKQYCGKDGLDEVFIVRNGYAIYQGDSVEKTHNIYSCSKSFTSTALGLMIEKGMCNLSTKASTIDPLLDSLYPNVQLRHFTTMTSGYSAKGVSRWNEPSEDWSWTPYQPNAPYFEPGTAYAYWDEAQMMFGRVLTQIADESMFTFISRELTDKIGLEKWSWGTEKEVNGTPINNGCTGVNLNAKQLARMGLLFLNEGNWNGEQLIDVDWVKQATSPQVSADIAVGETDRKHTDLRGRYGYNWWVRGDMGDMKDTPPKTFYMSGFNNNMCFVVPEWNMVIVRRGEDGNPKEGKRFVYNEFFKVLRTAVL